MNFSITFTTEDINYFEASVKYPDLSLIEKPQEAISTIYRILFTQGLVHLDKSLAYQTKIDFSDLGTYFSEEYVTINFLDPNPETQFFMLIQPFVQKILESKKSLKNEKIIHELKVLDIYGKLFSYQRDLPLNQLDIFFNRLIPKQASLIVAYTKTSICDRYIITDQNGSDYETLLKEIQAQIIANYPE